MLIIATGEQYGIGGPDSVRGYQLREVAGDRGYSGQAELYTPELARMVGLTDNYRLRLLGFYDWGGIQYNNQPPGTVQKDSIASAGLGIRMTYGKMVSFRLDLAQILQATANRENGSQRLTGSLAIVY